jgi:hypothetical protein
MVATKIAGREASLETGTNMQNPTYCTMMRATDFDQEAEVTA